jgi:hypothetical protein
MVLCTLMDGVHPSIFSVLCRIPCLFVLLNALGRPGFINGEAI